MGSAMKRILAVVTIVSLAVLGIGCGEVAGSEESPDSSKNTMNGSSSASYAHIEDMCRLVEMSCSGSLHVGTVQSSSVFELDGVAWTKRAIADGEGNLVEGVEPCGTLDHGDGTASSSGSCRLDSAQPGERVIVALAPDDRYVEGHRLIAGVFFEDSGGRVLDMNRAPTLFTTSEFLDAWQRVYSSSTTSGTCGERDYSVWCEERVALYPEDLESQ